MKNKVIKKEKKITNIYKWIIIIFGFIIYSNTLSNGYALDDKAVIWNNKFTQKGISGIKEILAYDSMAGMFGTDSNLEGGRYRPFSLVTFALEIELFGKKMTDPSARDVFNGCPFISHLFNILFFCCSLMILFKVLKKLFKNFIPKYEFLSIPFIATLLFAVHPLHTEIVANIKGRDEILAFLFSFLALNAIINYIDKNKKWELITAFVYMFLGSMAKETTITFLAIIPLCIYFFRDKINIKKYVFLVLPLFLGIILYFVCRHLAIGNQMGIEVINLMNNPFYGMTFFQKYATIIFTLLLYLKLMIFPHPLTWDYYPYHIEIYDFSNIWVIFSIIIHLALIVVAILGFKKKSIYSFCILFYAITLSITSNIFFNIGAFMNERFIFFSLLGLCILIAYLISEKFPLLIKNYKTVSLTLVSIILCLFSVKTFTRNFDWRNNITLFGHDVNISKNSAKGNCTYAGELYKLSEDAELAKDTVLRNKYLFQAKPYYEKAIEIYPQYEEALVALGNTNYRIWGDYKTMFKYYIKTLEKNPLNRDVWSNSIGVLTQNLNEPEYEKIIWKKYSEISDYYESFFQLGNLYFSSVPPQNDSAIYYYEKAKVRNFNNFDLLYCLGVSYGNISNFDKARENLLLALKIKQDAKTNQLIGISYGFQNNNEKALEYFEKAFSLDPNNQEIINNIIMAKKILGR
ncbi:MAG: tetratricopeptide repeat protein [Bacteroidales bacterium]|jgi:Tfp pilus assembly protein PilF|nr:tetratricopeptide repeat protein [Bacteroidales bacterium]